MNIILIQHEPLTERIETIFCIKEIIAAGFNFAYWDLSQICNPGIKLPNQLDYDFILKFNNLKEFEEKIHILDKNNTIIIAEIFFSYFNRKLWKIINSSKIKCIKFERYGNTTLGPANASIKDILKKLCAKDSLPKVYRKIFFAFYKKVFNLHPYDLLVTSANVKADCKVNHPDYDLYLEHKNDEPILNYKYIVFVDTGFGKHPDEIYFVGQKTINDNKLWQNKLCRFFDYIEEKYNLPVVIAVHPKLTYEDTEFGGRKKIKNETLNLITNAEFVLQDQSNSISYAVLDNKEVAFIVTKEYLRTKKDYMDLLVSTLGVKYFDIDSEDFNDFKLYSISDDIGDKYIYNYLTDKEIENTQTKTIFINYLKTLDSL